MDDNNNNNQDKKQEDAEKLLKQIEEIINRKKDKEGTDGKKVKKKVFGIEAKIFSKLYIDVIYHTVLTMLIGLAIYGFSSFYNISNILLFLVYLLIYGIVDYFAKYLLLKKGFRIYLMTFGLINIIISCIVYFGLFYLFGWLFNFSCKTGYLIISYLIIFFGRFIFDKYLNYRLNNTSGIRFKIGGKK